MLGARMHYAVPRALHEAGLLERFFTDSYAGNRPLASALLRAIPPRLAPGGVARWLGRAEPALPPDRVTSFEGLGLRYALARATARDDVAAAYAATNRAFNLAVLRRGLGGADAVWGFNGAALEIFAEAAATGRRRILEQTILPEALRLDLLRRGAEEHGGWESERSDGAPSALARREAQEWALADAVVAGSDFVADGLVSLGVPRAKVVTIPYGVPVDRFPPQPQDTTSAGPLRVLFVGEVGVRKGAPYLLDALRELGPSRVRARFVGRVAVPPDHLRPFRDVAEFPGVVPRSEVRRHFAWAQVFALPSLVEGSATVTYEALLSGLPVVTTPNTGSIVRDGVEGRIVPAFDTASLVTALGDYAANPELRLRHAEAARAGRARASLETYAARLVSLVRDVAGEGDVGRAR